MSDHQLPVHHTCNDFSVPSFKEQEMFLTCDGLI